MREELLQAKGPHEQRFRFTKAKSDLRTRPSWVWLEYGRFS